MSMRRATRYVERLLRGRRPRPFHVDDDEAAVLRTAIDLRVAQAPASAPRPEFVTALHRRLAAELAAERAATEPAATDPGRSKSPRRRVLAGAAGAAVAGTAVAAVAVEHAATTPAAAPGGGTLEPAGGVWQAVVDSGELPNGGVHPFDTGTVAGFVMRAAGRLWAVSATCTHQGCRLSATRSRQLDCPCHRTSFDLEGHVIHHQLVNAPLPLPTIQVREVDGTIQVLATDSTSAPPQR
ncbi:MAG: hypothetical protein AUI10_03910 [Actinobacteria bacterium 13_2_20CM_2_72_6]|nr:MAG: hypothetical protein AUI10_03910 [Actinobacteria bacterium 13_2_20CM_2_72_6]